MVQQLVTHYYVFEDVISNSWDNRYSVPGAGIRAGIMQYLNAQREFLKIYKLFLIMIYLRITLF